MYEPTLKNLTNLEYGKPPECQNQILQDLGTPHIDSYNYMIDEGLSLAVTDILPVEFDTKGKHRVKLSLVDATIHEPRVPTGSLGVKSHNIYPLECRQRHGTYSGKLEIKLSWIINGVEQMIIDRDIGQVPIMLKSKLCHLEKLTPEELVNHGEHQDEWGGYFIVKGKERLVRLLLGTRRNFPTAVKRNTWKNKDQYFSDIGIMIRCVKDDLTTISNTLHYLTNGTAKLMIPIKKRIYYAPIFLILKCLTNSSDEFIFRHIIKGHENDLYFIRSIMEMMRSLHESNVHSQEDAKEYVGVMFKPRFYELPEWKSNKEVCDFMIRNYVLIHLHTDFDKFKLLIFMLQKLFAVAQNKCLAEGADAIMMQELMLGGHLYLKILKEKLQQWLVLVRINLLKVDQGGPPSIGDMMTALKKCDFIEHSMNNFFATGNLTSKSGLGMQQDKGLTILVENISRMRYMAHFRAVHRGAIFESMRTTEPRRLLPDAWGFICPVHTPDGTPCGLLNHLTKSCISLGECRHAHLKLVNADNLKKCGDLPVNVDIYMMILVNVDIGTNSHI